MIVKLVKVDDCAQYKKPCLVLCFPSCTWKCCIEAGISISVCQNQEMCAMKDIDVSPEEAYIMYQNSIFSKAICCSGLEPMLQFDDVLSLLKYFREHGCDDDFVVYTGYYRHEIEDKISQLAKYKNVVVKYGRYVPNNEKHFDKVLGVWLASDNQYGERIS